MFLLPRAQKTLNPDENTEYGQAICRKCKHSAYGYNRAKRRDSMQCYKDAKHIFDSVTGEERIQNTALCVSKNPSGHCEDFILLNAGEIEELDDLPKPKPKDDCRTCLYLIKEVRDEHVYIRCAIDTLDFKNNMSPCYCDQYKEDTGWEKLLRKEVK